MSRSEEIRKDHFYFDYIPQDLINVIAEYLDYNKLIILEQFYAIKIDYQKLVKEKYPGFHKMLVFLKKSNANYSDYSWKRGYDLISRMDIGLQYLMDKSDI